MVVDGAGSDVRYTAEPRDWASNAIPPEYPQLPHDRESSDPPRSYFQPCGIRFSPEHYSSDVSHRKPLE